VRNRFAVSSRPIARGSCIGFIALILLCIHAAPAVVRSRINSQINPEVTQAAYQRIMNSNPSRYQGPQKPAEQIDWYSATNYCKRVGMRLPTESEWEYAALGKVQALRCGELNKIAWYDGNSGDMTHDVAQKQPNAYGLFDMLGNVWEWVEDVCACDPKRRLMKGGSFYNISRDLRVPNRETPLDTLQHRNVGFRCAANSLP
jgi:formylglycine-generating enzyme